MADELELCEEWFDTQVDFRRLKRTHETTGYREGLEAGEEVKLQEGFDEGFVWGTTYGAEWARVRGLLSALLSYVTSKDCDSKDEVTGQLMELLKEAHILEQKVNLDNLLKSPGHDTSKMLQENTQRKYNDHKESCNRTCREDNKNGDFIKECGGYCKETDKKHKNTQDTPSTASSECRCCAAEETDITQLTNKTGLPSGTELERFLLKCHTAVIHLGLDPDKILSPVQQLGLGQVSP